jgi:hypothetical protein
VARHRAGDRAARCGIGTVRREPLTRDARQGPLAFEAQADFGGFYNANGAKLIVAEVNREHGHAAADQHIRELDLERIFSFKSGPAFDGSLTAGRR